MFIDCMYRRLIMLICIVLVFIWFFSQSLQLHVGSWFSNDVEASWPIDDVVASTWSLWISPYDTEQKLTTLLWSTKNILYIQTYDFTHKNIRELVKKLALWWTDVRIMQENKKFQQYADTYQQVVGFFSGISNVQIQSDENLWTMYLHTKLDLLDDQYIIKTANLTQSAFKNREYFFVWSDPVIWENLHALFLKDRTWILIQKEDIHPNIAVCPINCRDVVEWLIANAQSSIRLQTQYVVDDKVINLLKEKRNFDLKINVADVDANDDILYYFGPGVARYLPKPYVHAKMLLIDDTYLLIWSINMSDNSMDNNRELWIVVTDPDVIAAYQAQFDRDREVSEGKWR